MHTCMHTHTYTQINFTQLLYIFSEPLSSTEMQLIRSSLIDNMNIDEPPFRQQLQTCIKHTVVRSRDTAIAALKANQTGESSTPLEDALGKLINTLA